MYCNSCSGGEVQWGNRRFPVRIGLQCGLEEMWDNKAHGCIPMNDTVKSHLLKSM